MLWKVRARVGDRPGTLGRLAERCGEGGLNILGLQIFPTPAGVVDELVLSTPTRWTDTDVVDLVSSAGGIEVSAAQCSLRTLQDPAVRYLQAASALSERGGSLGAVLEELLETAPPDAAEYAGHDELRIRTLGAPDTVVRRAIRFTPTERARAEALGALVERRDLSTQSRPPEPADSMCEPDEPADGQVIGVRIAQPGDVDALVSLHRRCSPRSLSQRYFGDGEQHAEVVDLVRRQVHSELPTLLAVAGGRVVGVATRCPDVSSHSIRCGLLVEDAWQRRGIGTSLLTAVARGAVAEGAKQMVLLARPGNDALLRTVGRCGFTARLRRVGADLGVTVTLTRLAVAQSVRSGSPVGGRQT
jgi:GNAT superfamily N-acetyltransferase